MDERKDENYIPLGINAGVIKILMYVADFVKGYNIYQYLFGIQLYSVLAKCWKLSKMQKMTYFHSFLQA